ncbi:MAG: hypothetical protein O2999_07795 [Nitrospirae bacterium]|nr:hypothetical protein [Nitrospirota bacterium]MDA1304188.1 hypothetical protein [Nitrospirota bacterium]
MKFTIRQAVTITVLGCLLSLNSVALPQVVMHSLHHDHHSSSTHNSPICFWVCTAGQMEESSDILQNPIAQIIHTQDIQLRSQPLWTPRAQQYPRGPPTQLFVS